MRIPTLQCPDCGTVVAANVLERHRALKCPGLDCEAELRFEDLPAEDREHVLANLEKYRME